MSLLLSAWTVLSGIPWGWLLGIAGTAAALIHPVSRALLKAIPWQLYAALALVLLGYGLYQKGYNSGRADERDKWERVVEEAEDRAAFAERAAQAAHEKRETIREIRTTTIREVARKADNANPEAAGRSCGPVTGAVLDSLRQASSSSEPPAPGVD